MLRFELLDKAHDRKSFDCGEPELNRFLQQTARQHLDKGVSRTFVLIDEDTPQTILGFFSLVVCEVTSEKLPAKWAKKYPGRIPGIKLARLAVGEEEQSNGYAGALLVEAMRRVVLGSEQVGVAAFFVDAKNESARSFYAHYGFISLPDNDLEMFLPLGTLKTLLEQ